MLISRREGHSDFLFEIAEQKVANSCHPAERSVTAEMHQTSAKTNHPLDKTSKITLLQARIARRLGKFVKIAGRNDLYQDASSNLFWKISDDKQYVVRMFDENDGVAKNTKDQS